MSSEKAALVIALDEIAKSRKRMERFISEAPTLEMLKEAVNGLPELKSVVKDLQARKAPVVVTIAKNKSHITKTGHLIFVYTDGTNEDVGDIRPKITLRAPPVGTGSGLDRDQVIQLIEATVATSPLAGYRISDEDSDATVKYYGYVDVVGNWYVMRVDDTGEIASYRYAKGASDYTAGWAGRAALIYVLLSELGL